MGDGNLSVIQKKINQRYSVISNRNILGGAKKILGSSSKTCNEAVRRNMGLKNLKVGGTGLS